jgi:preprotein translocase subunit SecG
MTSILMTVHVLVAIALVGVVLIQRGQGADIGASFGSGGAQTLFGSRGSGSFLGKLTGGLAATFMLTSLTLAFFTQQQAVSVVERAAPIQQPALPTSDGGAPAGFDPASLKALKSEDTLPTAGETQHSSSATLEIPISSEAPMGTSSADKAASPTTSSEPALPDAKSAK